MNYAKCHGEFCISNISALSLPFSPSKLFIKERQIQVHCNQNQAIFYHHWAVFLRMKEDFSPSQI